MTRRHKLECEVILIKLGNTSLKFFVTGSQVEKTCFTGNFVCVRVKSDSFQPTAGPDLIRQKLETEAYKVAEETV